MNRKPVALVIGLAVGLTISVGLGMAPLVIYSPPAGYTGRGLLALLQEILRVHPGAFQFIVAGYALGAFSGGLILSLLSRTSWVVGPLVIGVVLLVTGIVQVLAIQYPPWVGIPATLLTLPLALLGAWIGRRPDRDEAVPS